MKSKLFAVLLLAGSSLVAASGVVVGVGVGVPAPVVAYGPPPPPRVVYAPAVPRPGYVWIGGYWYPRGAAWAWRGGYWARPPYAHAYWVGPRWYGHRYYSGYWRR